MFDLKIEPANLKKKKKKKLTRLKVGRSEIGASACICGHQRDSSGLIPRRQPRATLRIMIRRLGSLEIWRHWVWRRRRNQC